MADYTSYIAGISIALASSFLSAVGLTAQKRVHKQLDAEKIDVKKRRYFLHPQWLLGISCMLCGALLSFAVFAFLGQARASAMASITILWNSGLAALFLGERFTPVDALTSGIIIAGASVAVVFGSSGAASQAVQTVDTLVASLQRTVAWSGAIILVAVYAAAYVFVRWSHSKKVAGTRSEALKRVECAVRVCMAGLFSGSTGMLAKNVVVCISQGVREQNILFAARFEFWLFVLGLPPSLILQLFYLNSSLAQLDALEVVPPYQCSIILVGLAWGFTFGEEAATSSPTAIGLFATGCSISCIGVTVLMLKRRLLALLDAARVARGLPAVYSIAKAVSEEVSTTPTHEADAPGVDEGQPLAPVRRRSNANDMHALVDALRQEEPHAVAPSEVAVPPSLAHLSKFETRRRVDMHTQPTRVRRESTPRIAPSPRAPVYSAVAVAILERARAEGDAVDHYGEHIASDVSTESITLWTSLLHVLGNIFRPLAWLSVQPFRMRPHVSEQLRRMLPGRRASATTVSQASSGGAGAVPQQATVTSSQTASRDGVDGCSSSRGVPSSGPSSVNASPLVAGTPAPAGTAMVALHLPPVIAAPRSPPPPAQPRSSITASQLGDTPVRNNRGSPGATVLASAFGAIVSTEAIQLPPPHPAQVSGAHATPPSLPGMVSRPPRGPQGAGQKANGTSSGHNSAHSSPSSSPFTSRAASPFTSHSSPSAWAHVSPIVTSAPPQPPVPSHAQHVSLMINPFLASVPSSRGDRVAVIRGSAAERDVHDTPPSNGSSSRAASPTA